MGSEETETGAGRTKPNAWVTVDDLKSELGGALRVVAAGDVENEAYELLYVRPDVREAYPDGAEDRLFENLVFEYLGSDVQEDDFEALGELQFTIRSFENGSVVIGLTEEVLVFVSIDGSDHFIPATMHLLSEQLSSDVDVAAASH